MGVAGIGWLDRLEGGVLGVVAGDALGLPVQFESREEVALHPVEGMRGHGTFDKPAGWWSDDGSLTLCTARSLAERGDLDVDDLAARFVRWYRDGETTPEGAAYDIGNATDRAMRNLLRGVPPLEAGPGGEYQNGNGSLMRILPVALFAAHLPPEVLVKRASDASRLTHSHARSRLACGLHALLAAELLRGAPPEAAYRALCATAETAVLACDAGFLAELPRFRRILDGGLASIPRDGIRGSGYVVDTLEAAIWCLLRTEDFRACALLAVNLGEDTDTVGAVAGGLAGVAYGAAGIPEEWIGALARADDVRGWARDFARAVPAPSAAP